MLALDETSLTGEIRDAEKERDKQLSILRELIRRYSGKFYRFGDVNETTPESYIFSYISFTQPQIAFRAPTVTCDVTRSVNDQAIAEGQAATLNYWMKETGFEDVLDGLALDTLFMCGVAMATVESRGDYQSGGLSGVGGDFEQQPNWVSTLRIGLRDFIIDSQCTSNTRARLIGHKFERDADDLAQDQRYDQTVIADLVGSERDSRRDENDPYPADAGGKQAKRKVFTLYQLYIPEHARVVTLAETGVGGSCRIVRNVPYFGPDEGPYTMFQIYGVPDRVWPLSALVATFESFLAVQTHAMAAADEASTQKSFAVGKKSRAADAEAVKNAKGGDVILVDDPDSVRDMTIGGTTKARIDYLERASGKYERDLGFGDAQHGIPNDDTATANSLAQQNSDLRMDYCRQRFVACTLKHLDKVRWYMWNLENFQRSFAYSDPQTGNQLQMEFKGGQWDGGYINNEYVPPQDPELDYSGFALNIVVGSMHKQDDAVEQKRAQDELQLCMSLQQMGMPVNWRRELDRYGAKFNEKDFSKIILLDPMGQMVPPDPLAMQQTPPWMQGPYPQQRNAGPGQSSPGGMPQPSLGQRPAVGAGPASGMTQRADLMRQAGAGV